LALVRDLMFSSKISATARSIGTDVNIVRDPAALADQPGQLLLVDLNLPGGIEAAAQWRAAHAGKVVGFVSHVDTATITRARDAGLDQIMARSGFVEALPTILNDYRNPTENN
jgi:DNA-binding NarL/FixJ family response regulator